MNVRSVAMPSRLLCAKKGEKPLKYVDKDNSDIRLTFQKAIRLMAQQKKTVEELKEQNG